MAILLEAQRRDNYQCCKTVEFGKAFRKLDKSVQKIIHEIVRTTLPLFPYESKRLVSPELRGKRSYRKGDYRIIFAICEECRTMHLTRLNACEDCFVHSDDEVMLFVCGHRKRIYDA